MNFHSNEWAEVVARVHDQIAKLDERNRDAKLDAYQTASIRGQIAALLGILNWPEQAKATMSAENEVILE